MSKTNSKRIIAAVLVIGLLVAGYFALPMLEQSTEKPGEKKGSQQAKIVKVTVATPVSMPIVEWDEYIGRMEAVESVEIRARISGYLNAHYFEEGDVVESGDRLFLIDPRPFQAALAEAKAGLSQAKAGSVEAKATEFQSKAQRKQVEARVELATVRLRRYGKLKQGRSVSEDEYDVANSEMEQASADLAAADAAIASAAAHSSAAEAAVASAEAVVQTAELNLSFTDIRAPIGGRISRRFATKGNLIAGGTVGATLLTTIVSVDPIHCYFEANERELLKYVRLDRSGDRESSRTVKNPVFLSLIDEDGFPHQGHMDFVDNRIDANTGTIRGRAIFPNPDKVLASGMFADLRLPGSGRYEAILIPDSAIGRDQSEQFLIVVGDDNKTERRSVKLGPIVHGLRVVRSGLKPNERIVTRGLQRVRPGDEVTPESETIKVVEDDGLPDDYTPIPREQWLTPKPSVAPTSEPNSAENSASAIDKDGSDQNGNEDANKDADPSGESDGETNLDPTTPS